MMKYRTIYADPPWKTKAGIPMGAYKKVKGKQVWNPSSNKSRELAYPTMTVEEIKNYPVDEMADENCHLYLWTTNQYLPDAFDVIDAWGFTYSTTLVWAKNPMGGGLGGTFKITTEFLLFATKGKCNAKSGHTGTWFYKKRDYTNGKPQHSRKPEFFAQLIESVSHAPFIELFARRERNGWAAVGNQLKAKAA